MFGIGRECPCAGLPCSIQSLDLLVHYKSSENAGVDYDMPSNRSNYSQKQDRLMKSIHHSTTREFYRGCLGISPCYD